MSTESQDVIPDRAQHIDAAWHGPEEAQAKLVQAWADASVEFEEIDRDSMGQIGNRYFKYAPLVNLTKATRKVLGKHGIVCLQDFSTSPIAPHPEHGPYHRLTTEVCGHGARRKSVIDFLPARVPNAERSDRDSPQVTNLKEYGKQTTYLRRYAYQCMFVLDGEPDADDGGKLPAAESQPRGSSTPKPATRAKADEPRQERSQARESAEKTVAELRAKGIDARVREAPPANEPRVERDPDPQPASTDPEIEAKLRASLAANGNGHSELERDEPPLTGPITDGQKQALRALAIKLRMAGPVLAEKCKQVTGKSATELNAADAAKLIEALQS